MVVIILMLWEEGKKCKHLSILGFVKLDKQNTPGVGLRLLMNHGRVCTIQWNRLGNPSGGYFSPTALSKPRFIFHHASDIFIILTTIFFFFCCFFSFNFLELKNKSNNIFIENAGSVRIEVSK